MKSTSMFRNTCLASALAALFLLPMASPAEEAGIEFIEPDPDFLAESEAFAADDAATAARIARDDLGIADADEKVARFQELVVKWDGLLADTNNDPAAVATKVQQEVWDKVDFATYGQAQ